MIVRMKMKYQKRSNLN